MPQLICKSCSRPILLPAAARPYASEGQGSWPKDGAPRNFSCHWCRHIHEYSAQEVKPSPASGTIGHSKDKPHNVVCIELPCDTGKCPSELRIRTLMPTDLDPVDYALDALGPIHGIRCDKGHIQSRLPRQGSAFGAHIDEDWLVVGT